jgi:hypothetical protein
MMKMPVAALLLEGSPIAMMGPVLKGLKEPGTPGLDMVPEVHVPSIGMTVREHVVTCVREAVPFNVQVAADLYWGNKKDYYRLDKDFGPMRCPYPEMWMEWHIPAEGYFQGEKFHHDEVSAYVGAYLFEKDGPAEVPQAEKVITVQFLALTSGVAMRGSDYSKPLMMNDVALTFAVDNDGLYVANSLIVHYAGNPDQYDMLVAEAKSNLYIVGMALNLINCRNVKHAPAGTIPMKRSGTDKRRGVEPIRYRTILLPGMTVERAYATRKQQAANAAVLRQHMVRGHFKTFTREAPLLGKHVGTYWWSPGVRGNPDRGKVVQDYKIGEQGNG